MSVLFQPCTIAPKDAHAMLSLAQRMGDGRLRLIHAAVLDIANFAMASRHGEDMGKYKDAFSAKQFLSELMEEVASETTREHHWYKELARVEEGGQLIAPKLPALWFGLRHVATADLSTVNRSQLQASCLEILTLIRQIENGITHTIAERTDKYIKPLRALLE